MATASSSPVQTVLNNPLPGRQFKYLQNALINFLVSLIFCDGRQWHKSLHYDSLVLTIPRNPNLTLRIMWSVWERSDFKYDEMEIILFQGNFYIFTKIFVWETHRGETYWRSPGWVDDLCTLVRETRRNIFN